MEERNETGRENPPHCCPRGLLSLCFPLHFLSPPFFFLFYPLDFYASFSPPPLFLPIYIFSFLFSLLSFPPSPLDPFFSSSSFILNCFSFSLSAAFLFFFLPLDPFLLPSSFLPSPLILLLSLFCFFPSSYTICYFPFSLFFILFLPLLLVSTPLSPLSFPPPPFLSLQSLLSSLCLLCHLSSYHRRWYLSPTLMTANCKEIGTYKPTGA